MKTQIDLIKAPGVYNREVVDNQWREGVGGAQKLLPVHVVYEYCANRSFYPTPDFTQRPESSTLFFNFVAVKYKNWFNADSTLGSECAVYKGNNGAEGISSGGRESGTCVTARALKALCKVRTLDFINLQSQLEKRAILDNHQQVVPM